MKWTHQATIAAVLAFSPQFGRAESNSTDTPWYYWGIPVIAAGTAIGAWICVRGCKKGNPDKPDPSHHSAPGPDLNQMRQDALDKMTRPAPTFVSTQMSGPSAVASTSGGSAKARAREAEALDPDEVDLPAREASLEDIERTAWKIYNYFLKSEGSARLRTYAKLVALKVMLQRSVEMDLIMVIDAAVSKYQTISMSPLYRPASAAAAY